MSVRIAVFCVLVWCGHGSLGACGPGVWSAQLQLCLCPDHYGGPQCQYHSASEAVQAPDRALEQAAFNRLYTEGLGSGDGSTVSVTEDVRHFLREAIDGYGIKSMLDVPCGDLAWMPHTNLSGVYYMGADLSPFVIEHHQRKYKNHSTFRRFFVLDLVTMVPPPADMILLRDVLFHLPLKDTAQVLSNINLSGAKYLATTSFANTSNPLMSQTSLQSLHAHNWTVMAPGRRGKRKKQTPIAVTRFDYFYRINLWAPPFRLGPALLEREERFIRHGHIPRFVALWRLPVPVPDLRGMDST